MLRPLRKAGGASKMKSKGGADTGLTEDGHEGRGTEENPREEIEIV